jgi:hypothetical protein
MVGRNPDTAQDRGFSVAARQAYRVKGPRCHIDPEMEERIKSKLKMAGHKNPSLFGEYRYL